jgi:hypothetical protein
MEPQYMILGQAAGVAASLALKLDKAVQEIPVASLQEKLRSQGAVFDWVAPVAGPAFFNKLFQLYESGAGKRALTPGQ